MLAFVKLRRKSTPRGGGFKDHQRGLLPAQNLS